MAKCQKDPTCGISMKRGLFECIKMILPCVRNTNTKYKYTNTADEEVPKRLNMWRIFEKRIVQGYQKCVVDQDQLADLSTAFCSSLITSG